MKWIVQFTALALVTAGSAALAQTTKPDVSGAPSAQNSGAGIPGLPGNKSGPAVRPGDAGGSAASANQQNTTVQQQDTSKIQGMPGNKNGPPARSAAQAAAGNTQTLPQEIKQKLESQGFSNVQVVPGSFIVSAKDKQGDPVNMVIGPHTMMMVTTSNVSDTSGGSQQQGFAKPAQ